MHIYRTYIFFLLLIIAVRADAQFMFSKTYGFGLVNDGRYIIQTSDNGYAVCGSTTPGSGGQTNFYLLKTDSMGVASFQYSFGGAGIEQSSVLVQTPDSGFLIAGYSNSFSVNNDYDVYLVRTDKSGNLMWSKSFGTSGWDFIYDMKETSNGNYILAGNSYGSTNGTSSGYIVKIDSAGNLIWQKFIISTQQINLKQLAIRSDDSFVVCGNISPSSSYPADGFVAFLDLNGDTTKTVIVDNGKHETFNAVGFFSNGDLALGGNSIDSSAQNNADEMIARMDSNGNTIWIYSSSASGTDVCNDLIVYNDTLITIGSTTSFGGGNSDYHILKYDQNGGFIKGITFGAAQNEFGFHISNTNDHGFIMVGSSTSFAPGQQSILVVKCDSLLQFNPNVTINISELISESSFTVFPNPCSKFLTIDSKYIFENFNLRLINNEGKLMLEKHFVEMPLKINLSGIQSGLYFLEIENRKYFERKKVIIFN